MYEGDKLFVAQLQGNVTWTGLDTERSNWIQGVFDLQSRACVDGPCLVSGEGQAVVDLGDAGGGRVDGDAARADLDLRPGVT